MLDKVNRSIMERLVVQLEQQDRKRAETVEPAMHGVESAMDEETQENEAHVKVHTTAVDVNMRSIGLEQ